MILVGIACLTVECARPESSQPSLAPAPALFDPPAIYLTWQRDPTTTMTVQWHGDGKVRDSRLEFQATGQPRWQSATHTTIQLPRSERVVHRAELTGLTPNTDYRFRFGEGPVVYKFRTMPADTSRPIRFVVGADMKYPDEYSLLCREAARRDAMFAVIGGDIAYTNGGKPEAWYEWLSLWKQNMVTADGRLIPVLPVIGNHEVKGEYGKTPEASPYFYRLFATPGTQGYQVLDFGSYMSVILLDSGHTHPVGGAQTDWLRDVLSKRTDMPHVFAAYHVPAYPSSRDEDEDTTPEIRQHWVPLFEQHGLDVAFEGHDHTYKRTYVLKAGSKDSTGVLYLGDGAWGTNLRGRKKRWYLVPTPPNRQHVILVTVEGQGRSFQAIGMDGKPFDQCRQGPVSDSTIPPCEPP
jgi:hypothetical protein